MWALALYSKVMDEYRAGTGEHPSVVFGRIAKEVLGRERERLALAATRRDWNGPVDVAALRDATVERPRGDPSLEFEGPPPQYPQ